MRQRISSSSRVFFVGVLVLGAVLAEFPLTRAEDAAPAASVKLDAARSLRDNLASVQGTKKVVDLVLRNGKSYRGLVAGVGEQSVVLTELQGREFFDALVMLEDISALELKVR